MHDAFRGPHPPLSPVRPGSGAVCRNPFLAQRIPGFKVPWPRSASRQGLWHKPSSGVCRAPSGRDTELGLCREGGSVQVRRNLDSAFFGTLRTASSRYRLSFLTPAAKKTKTQVQNSWKKLNLTEALSSFLEKLKKKTQFYQFFS